MNSYLKIKVLSLGAEIGLIKREERKWLKRSRWCASVLKGRTNTRVSLDDASRQRAHALDNFWGLRGHRLGLRPDARHANIAYGFVRGRAYKQVEAKAYNQPHWSKVIKLVERYGEAYKGKDVQALIEEWYKK